MKSLYIFYFILTVSLSAQSKQSVYESALVSKNIEYIKTHFGYDFSKIKFDCKGKPTFKEPVIFFDRSSSYIYYYKNGVEKILGLILFSSPDQTCRYNIFLSIEDKKNYPLTIDADKVEFSLKSKMKLTLFSQPKNLTSAEGQLLPANQIGRISKTYPALINEKKTNLVFTSTPSTFHSTYKSLPLLNKMHSDLGFDVDKFIYLSKNEFLLIFP